MDEVTIDIDAPPELVWALITDVTQMGRRSPECRSCKWLGGASGPTVGSRFKGHNKRGLMQWNTVSTVVTADAPSLFEFEVKQSRMRWGYRLEPTDTGTSVREYREEIGPKPLHVRVAYALRLLGNDPDAIVRAGMKETLARLKTEAETGTETETQADAKPDAEAEAETETQADAKPDAEAEAQAGAPDPPASPSDA